MPIGDLAVNDSGASMAAGQCFALMAADPARRVCSVRANCSRRNSVKIEYADWFVYRQRRDSERSPPERAQRPAS